MNRIISVQVRKKLTAFVMIVVMTALSVFNNGNALNVYAGSDDETEKITVYLTISDDSEFVTGKDGDSTVLARVPIELSYEDLADYGLSEYRRYEAYDFDDGGEYITDSAEIKEPTLLMLMLKAVATYYYGDPDRKDFVPGDGFTCEGSAMHLFITKFFKHDHNLMYFVNHEFPKQNKYSGATADYCLLGEDDEIDIAMFTDYDFNQHGGFANFIDTSQEGETGREISNTLVYTPTVVEDEQMEHAETDLPMAGEKIKFSKDHGRTWQDSGCVTGEDGSFDITFYEPGEYLISAGPKYKYMADRGIDKACIAPPIATVNVTQSVPSDEEVAKEQEDREAALAKLSDLDGYESSLQTAKAECDSLIEGYNSLWQDVLTAKAAYDAVKSEPTQAAIRAAESYKEHALAAKTKAEELVQEAGLYKNLAEEYKVKVELAKSSAEAWRKSAAIVSSGKYQDAKAAYDQSVEAVSSATDHLNDAVNAASGSATYGSEAEEEYIAAETALSDAIRAKEEADARKSKEEKAADDLEDALELLTEYNSLKQELDAYAKEMNTAVSDYMSKKKQVETLIERTKKSLVKPGTKVPEAAVDAKAVAAKLKAQIEGLEAKLQSVRNSYSETVKITGYLGEAASKALESNSEISEEKKAEAQAVVDDHSEAEVYLGGIKRDIDSAEELQNTEPAAISQIVKDADTVYKKAVAACEKVKKAVAAAKKLKVKGLKAKSKKLKFTVSWKKTKEAGGYQVQYKLKSAKKFSTLKASVSKTKAASKKLKKGKKYIFRVRTWKKVAGKKVYGKWTKTKAVKCK